MISYEIHFHAKECFFQFLTSYQMYASLMGCLNSWYKCMMGKEDTDHFQISVTEVTSRKITATLSSLFIDVIVFLHRDFRFLVSFSFCYFFLFHFGLFFFLLLLFFTVNDIMAEFEE